MARHVVARMEELPPGSRKRVSAGGRDVVIFNLDGEVYGLLDRCPHQGGSLCDGVVTGFLEPGEPGEYAYSRDHAFIRCPWHGWHFDIRTGQSWGDPERVKTKPYRVSVEDGRQLAEGPYVAETVKVSVEERYVVVED